MAKADFCCPVLSTLIRIRIDAGTDIHIHVPLEAEMTQSMVDQIVQHKASCVPTLATMKGYADSPLYGYKKDDYKHSENNVRMLYEAGIPILAGTDASNIIFLPKVRFGADFHKEMKLMAGAGMTPLEVLKAAMHFFSRSLRIQLANTKVKVYEILPPMVDTDLAGVGAQSAGVNVNEFTNAVMDKLADGVEEIGYASSEVALSDEYTSSVALAEAQKFWNIFSQKNPIFENLR